MALFPHLSLSVGDPATERNCSTIWSGERCTEHYFVSVGPNFTQKHRNRIDVFFLHCAVEFQSWNRSKHYSCAQMFLNMFLRWAATSNITMKNKSKRNAAKHDSPEMSD